MAKMILEILDLPDGTIQVKCSSDVDVDHSPITQAMVVMSEILAALQGASEGCAEAVVARRH